MSKASLRTPSEFGRVLRTGRRARRDGLTVHVAEGRRDLPSRLGLAVRAPRAVDRNLLKRRLRAAWRELRPEPGFDVAVRVDGAALRVPYQELEIHLHEACRAAGMGAEQ